MFSSISKLIGRGCGATSFLMLFAFAFAASLPALTIGAANTQGPINGQATLNIAMTTTGSEAPHTVAFRVEYNPLHLSYASHSSGLSVIGAQKTITVTAASTGQDVSIGGTSAFVLADGALIHMTFNVLPTAPVNADTTVTFSMVSATDPSSTPIANPNGSTAQVFILSGPISTIRPRAFTSGGAGTTVQVPIELNVAASVDIASLQIDLLFDASGLTQQGAVAGASATAAGASLSTSPQGAAGLRINITGATQRIESGTVAVVTFGIGATFVAGAQFQVLATQLSGTSMSAAPLENLEGGPGLVVVPRVLVGPSADYSGRIGGAFSYPISLGTPVQTSIAALQFEVSFNSQVFTFTGSNPGAAATAANASVSTNLLVSGDRVRVVVFGTTIANIGNGTIAILNFTVAAGTTPGVERIDIGELVVSDPSSLEVPYSVPNGANITLSLFDDEDVNQDGLVDVVDVQLTVNIILSLFTPTYPGQGDANKDNVTDVVDVQTVVNKILNP